MYPIYHQIGKARLADWHAQAQRDALARAARRARREQRPPTAARRLLSGQLQSWRDTLGTLAGPTGGVSKNRATRGQIVDLAGFACLGSARTIPASLLGRSARCFAFHDPATAPGANRLSSR
jgi:hypothetical protein